MATQPCVALSIEREALATATSTPVLRLLDNLRWDPGPDGAGPAAEATARTWASILHQEGRCILVVEAAGGCRGQPR
jgi:hypothetical protein